jgi:hypothetical protein
MALFQYTAAQEGIQTAPFQASSQPNMAAAKAFAGIQEGLLQALKGATAVKQDVSETNYREAKIKLQDDVNYMNTRLADSDFEGQKELFAEFEAKTTQYSNPKNKYEQALYADYQAQLGAYGTALVKSGVEDNYATNLLDQNARIVELGQEFNNSASFEERKELVSKFDSLFVTPLEGFDDKYSRDLMSKALTAKGKLTDALSKERIAIKDNLATANAFELITQPLTINGSLTKEDYALAKSELAKRSDYSVNSTVLLKQLGDRALYAITSSNLAKKSTRENADLFESQIADFVKLNPNSKGSPTLQSALNSVATFKKTIVANEASALGLLVATPTYPISQVEQAASNMLNNGDINRIQFEASMFRAMEVRKTKTISGQVANAYASGNVDALVKLTKDGSGAAVSTGVSSNIITTLSTNIQNNMPFDTAIGIAFKEHKEFQDKGIYLKSIPQIETVLDYPETGKLQTPEDIAVYLATVAKAKENGYASKALQKHSNDALILKTWTKLGIPDIASKYQAYKTNPAAVSDKDARLQYNLLVDNEFSFRKLTDNNNVQLRNVLLPAIKAGLKAGLTTEDIKDWESLVEDSYYDVGSYFGFNKRIMLPKDSPIANKNIYDNVKKHYPNSSVVPEDILNGNGNWLIQLPDGTAEVVSADFLLQQAKQKPTK